MSLCPLNIRSRHSTDELETPMTTHTATSAFINALIVRVRASMTTGAQSTGIQQAHSRPMIDPLLIPAYRRRARLPRRGAHEAHVPSTHQT